MRVRRFCQRNNLAAAAAAAAVAETSNSHVCAHNTHWNVPHWNGDITGSFSYLAFHFTGILFQPVLQILKLCHDCGVLVEINLHLTFLPAGAFGHAKGLAAGGSVISVP